MQLYPRGDLRPADTARWETDTHTRTLTHSQKENKTGEKTIPKGHSNLRNGKLNKNREVDLAYHVLTWGGATAEPATAARVQGAKISIKSALCFLQSKDGAKSLSKGIHSRELEGGWIDSQFFGEEGGREGYRSSQKITLSLKIHLKQNRALSSYVGNVKTRFKTYMKFLNSMDWELLS